MSNLSLKLFSTNLTQFKARNLSICLEDTFPYFFIAQIKHTKLTVGPVPSFYWFHFLQRDEVILFVCCLFTSGMELETVVLLAAYNTRITRNLKSSITFILKKRLLSLSKLYPRPSGQAFTLEFPDTEQEKTGEQTTHC